MTLTTTPKKGVDEPRAVTSLVAAFAADPVIRWLYPDAARYLASFPELVRLLGADAFAAGTAAVAEEHAGTALWVAPDAQPEEEALVEHLQRTVPATRLDDVLALLAQMVEHHPLEPVWYLPFIGVDPAHQCRGIGSVLLAAGLARADRDGLPAYLEASTVRNRALYERHGFVLVAELRAGDSPPLWPMIREARS